MKKYFTFIVVFSLLTSCVGKKKYDMATKDKMAIEEEMKQIKASLKKSQEEYADLMKKYNEEQARVKSEKQMADAKASEYQTKLKSL